MKLKVDAKNQTQILEFAEQHTPSGDGFSRDCVGIGVYASDALVAAVYFDNFQARMCNVHVASDEKGAYAHPSVLRKLFLFPFGVLNYSRVNGYIPVSILAAITAALKFGFKPEGILRQADHVGGDIMILGLLRSECQFLPKALRLLET